MTKEQFLVKWGDLSRPLKSDLDAVIAHEIAKAKGEPEKTNKIEITPHTLVEINRAFRVLKEDESSYIHNVFSDDGVFDAMNEIRQVYKAYFGGEERQIQPDLDKPAPNPIEQAYDAFKPIRAKCWGKDLWIKKYTEGHSICNKGGKFENLWDFKTNPNDWELYTEPDTDQGTDQDAPKFDQDRFEAMFRAVVASGRTESYDQDFLATNICLEKLDAYYASQKGGENG